LLLSLWPHNAAAEPTPCPQPPVTALRLLIDALGTTVGEPLECLHGSLTNSDLLQQTTTGLLIYKTDTATAVFTDGWLHWAITAEDGLSGLSGWGGSGLDPPSLEFASISGGAPGTAAAVVIRTSPGASCSIGYVTPSGSASHASGLTLRTAGPDGLVVWAWQIGPSTRQGTGTVTVTCDGVSRTEVLPIE
jgi:hypothetical protein